MVHYAFSLPKFVSFAGIIDCEVCFSEYDCVMAKSAKVSGNSPGHVPAATFVLDNGGYTLKAGFAPAGEASDENILASCTSIPNYLVRSRDRKTYIASGADEIVQWSEAIFRRPVENGQIVSWETQKEIWEHSLFDQGTATAQCYIASPEDTTLILTDPPNTLHALQRNTDEMVMEEWGFGGYMRTVGPALNAYNDLHPLFEDPDNQAAQSLNEQLPMECLLVIDCGYSCTTIIPCFQGHVLQRAVTRLDIGGKHLTNLLKETISVRHFDLHQDNKIVNDIKEDTSFVSLDIKRDLEWTWKGNKTKRHPLPSADDDHAEQDIRLDYVLPDGLNRLRGFSRPHNSSYAAAKKRRAAASGGEADEAFMTLGNERFMVPEVLFHPSDIGSKQAGLADSIIRSLTTLPPLIQATMLANTLVVGGTAAIPGLVERLEADLRARVKTEWPVRVRKQTNPDKSTWLGGARLASNHKPIIQQYAITREQYNELGSTRINQIFLHGG